MGQSLLILGAGIYSSVTAEIAREMRCFERIDFTDDVKASAFDGTPVVGTVGDVENLIPEYDAIIVALGNPDVRLALLRRIEEIAPDKLRSLISPRAYVSPHARLGKGCIIEPMAVVHTGSVLKRGCLISAGAVVNHGSVCEECVHIDCNATVVGYATVPAGTTVACGTVFQIES